MLSVLDQENLVHGHQQAAATKPLNQSTRALPPKTPGNRYPKTPLKANLHDENEPLGAGGFKTGLATKGKGIEGLTTRGLKGAPPNKNAFVTPLGPRNRAPLGAKTTNAKAKAFQTPGGPAPEKEMQKTAARPTSTRRQKIRVSNAEPIKLDVHADMKDPLEEIEVEYCPPRSKDLPYESDVFPEGCINLDCLKSPNFMRNWHSYYMNPVDEEGVSLKERDFEAKREQAGKETDEMILRALEEEEWTIGDVPGVSANFGKDRSKVQPKDKSNETSRARLPTSTKGPGTIASRSAASMLSIPPKGQAATPAIASAAAKSKPTSFLARGRAGNKVTGATTASATRYTPAVAASKSTIGYSKGRNASNVLHMRDAKGPARATSTLSSRSSSTITPAVFAQRQNAGTVLDDLSRLHLADAFNSDEEELEPCMRGEVPDFVRQVDEDVEEFVFTLGRG